MRVRLFAILSFILACFIGRTQTGVPAALTPDPQKEAMYLPYLAAKHGGMQAIAAWKSENTLKYYQELWYYCKSFYIKPNQYSEGVAMDPAMIDISRFEQQRNKSTEAVVMLSGFRDALVLLPEDQLVYKP